MYKRQSLERFNADHGIHRKSTDTYSEKEEDQTEIIEWIRNNNKTKKQPFLDGVYGELSGYRYRIPSNEPITIGRGRECQICIKNSTVISKIHFDIFYDSRDDLFYLEDHSRNGTYINGAKCERGKFYWLEPGSKISLANNTCIFQVGVLNE